jgi:hypothetical protein
VTALNSEGTKLFDLTTTNWIESFIKLKDGRIAAMMYENGASLKYGLGRKGLGREHTSADEREYGYSGSDQYIYILTIRRI